MLCSFNKDFSLKYSLLNNIFLLYSNYLEGEEDYVIELTLKNQIDKKIFDKNVIYKSFNIVEKLNLIRFKFDNQIESEKAYEELSKLPEIISIEMQKP